MADRRGRVDLAVEVDGSEQMLVIIEIKATGWNKMPIARRMRNLLCVPKSCATWVYAPQLAVGLVLRLAPGGQVSAWPGCDDLRLVGLK